MIPTSLVGMLDAAIGGKNGVNLPEGKNLEGTIYQPRFVLADPRFLETLSQDELRNGLAEAIKYGMIKNKWLFDFILRNHKKQTMSFYKTLIQKSASIKAKVAGADIADRGLREILNLGHTVGHALEAHSNFAISHGEAVAKGMVEEARFAQELGFIKENKADALEMLLLEAGFSIGKIKCTPELIPYMKRDKKNKDEKIHCVIVTGIGSVHVLNGRYSHPIPEELILKRWN